jgi:hypothetical protein
MVEAQQTWTFTTSTGARTGKALELSGAIANISVYFTTSSGCTATVALETCAGSSAGPWVGMEASTILSTGATLLRQYSGPLDWVRPSLTKLTASTDVVTVYLLAN